MLYCDQCCKEAPSNDRIFTESGGVICEECRQKNAIKEYAFGVTLNAVIRVKAKSEAEALEKLAKEWDDEIRICHEEVDTRLTAASLRHGPGKACLFEVKRLEGM